VQRIGLRPDGTGGLASNGSGLQKKLASPALPLTFAVSRLIQTE